MLQKTNVIATYLVAQSPRAGMDDYCYLSGKKTNTLCQFFLKNRINKTDLNKMVSGAKGAELRLAAVKGTVGNGFRIGPSQAPGLFDAEVRRFLMSNSD